MYFYYLCDFIEIREFYLDTAQATAYVWRCIQKFPDGVDDEVNKKQQTLVEKQHKGLWRQNSIDWLTKYTIAPSGRELYHLQFSLLAASPETFGYTLVSNGSL
jgi:hypothetical protein